MLLSKYPQLNSEEWVRKQAETKTAREIAEEVGCSQTTVMYAIKKYEIALPNPNRRGNSSTHTIYPQLQDESWLREEITKKPMRQIAAEIGCSVGAVNFSVHRKFHLAMPLRTPPGVKGAFCKFPQLHQEDWLRKEIEAKSYHKIAQEIGCSYGAIVSAVRKFGIEPPPRNKPRTFRDDPNRSERGIQAWNAKFPHGRFGKDSPSWRGGRVSLGRYIGIYMPEHADADQRGYVLEHRFIMEQHIGRPLAPGEMVHHKNRNPKDNAIDNLELMMNRKHHADVHFGAVAKVVDLEAENKALRKKLAAFEAKE